MAKKISYSTILIFICWLSYTVAYIGRYSYSTNITLIMEDYGINHQTAALPTTLFFISYGAGQIINGIFCKYYPKRYVISIALVISALINFTLFFKIPFSIIPYLWLVNGFCQSMLWSSIVLSLSEKLEEKLLNKAIMAMGTPAMIGPLVSYGLSSLLAISKNYQYMFLIASIAIGISGITWFFLFKDEKKTLPITKENKNKQKLANSMIVLIIILAFFAVLNNLIKDGLTTWVPTILKESFNLGDSLSIILSIFLPTFSVFGTALAIRFNKSIKDYIILITFFYTFTLCLIVPILFLLNTPYYIVIILVFSAISLLMFAINHIITTIAPLQLRNKINSGFLSGILDGFCYVGSSISSYGLGSLADASGWKSVFILFIILAGLAILVGVSYAIISLIIKRRKA